MSQHLKELKNSNLIKGNVEGKRICYSINDKGFAKIKNFFGNINSHIEK